MAHIPNPPGIAGQAPVYQIRLAGHLGQEWAEWFGALRLSQQADGDTLLTGPIADQAALHGVLRRVRDLGLPLVSVRRLSPGVPDSPHP